MMVKTQNYWIGGLLIVCISGSIYVNPQKWIRTLSLNFIVVGFLIAWVMLNRNTNLTTIANQQGTVIEAKPSYAIIKINHQKYYLSNFQLKLLLDQRVIINAKVEALTKSHYFVFPFDNYLNDQRVFKQLKDVQLTNQSWHYLRYYFYEKVFNFANHELVQVFLFNIRDKSQTFQKQLEHLNVGYLLNFNSLSIWGLWTLFSKIGFISKHKKALNLMFGLFWIWWYFLNCSWLLMRFLIKATLKNQPKLKSWSNFASFWVPCLIFPSYVGSRGFLYFVICYLFIKLFNQQSSKLMLIGVFLIPLKIYYDYQINLTAPIWDFILVPILLTTNLLTTVIVICGNNQQWLNYLSIWLVHLFKIVKWLSYSFNLGYQNLYGVILIYLVLLIWFSYHWKWKHHFFWLALVISIYLLNWLLKPQHHLEMLNVGNGNSFVYFNKYKNLTILFDCGVGKGFSTQIPTQYLRYLGVNKVDAIFISHNHQDHFNALENLQRNFQIKAIYYRDTTIEELTFKNVTIRVFSNPVAKSENNKSLTIFVDVNKVRLLFTGDIEKASETYFIENLNFVNYLKQRPVDILQIPHHGSKTSSSYEFIKLVNPKIALISGMVYQRLRFPDQQTISTLNFLRISYYVTAGVNNIRIALNSGYIQTL